MVTSNVYTHAKLISLELEVFDESNLNLIKLYGIYELDQSDGSLHVVGQLNGALLC